MLDAVAAISATEGGATSDCCGPVEVDDNFGSALYGSSERDALPAGTVDVVISNCVINLSVDKPAVFAETFRVLNPGGRLHRRRDHPNPPGRGRHALRDRPRHQADGV